MCPIWIVFVISGIIQFNVSALWVTTEDFSRSELANLTPQKEHELMLKKLSEFKEGILTSSFYYEMLSISIGNNFFGFVDSKEAAQECHAIIKAAFECIKNLQIQDKVEALLFTVSQNGATYMPISGGFALAFPLVCSDIDFYLKNETLYTTFRNRYKKEKYSPPSKIYHRGIAKSGADEIKALEELLNEPKMKPLIAHLAWVWLKHSNDLKLKDIKNTVNKLAKVPYLSQKVQNIYQRSIDAMIPRLKRVESFINVDGARRVYFSYLQPNFTEALWGNIIREIPDWTDHLECYQISNDNLDPGQTFMKQWNVRCGRMQLNKGSIFTDAWPATKDFDTSELEHLTQQQEHDLFLMKLATKNLSLIQNFIYLELLAKSIGHDFFGLTKDKTDDARNNAIVKAVFECIANLEFQLQFLLFFGSALKHNVEIVRKTGDISAGFSQFCSNMDDTFRSKTIYLAKRDAYMKQKLIPPKMTYQYGIGKPEEDQIKIIAKLLNDPALRKYWAHFIWMVIDAFASSKSDEEKTKYSILFVADVPSKSEAVQKLYEQSIDEIVPLIQDFDYNLIYQQLSSSDDEVIGYDEADTALHQTFLVKLMVSKIKKYPDLQTMYDAFYSKPVNL